LEDTRNEDHLIKVPVSPFTKYDGSFATFKFIGNFIEFAHII